MKTNDIGRKLRMAREGRQISCHALAKRMGVSTSTVTRWEAGKDLHVSMFLRACHALAVKPERLIGSLA